MQTGAIMTILKILSRNLYLVRQTEQLTVPAMAYHMQTTTPSTRPHIFYSKWMHKSLTLNGMCTCYFASGSISVSKWTAREKKPSHMELHLSTIYIGRRLQYANADGIMPMQLSFVVYNSIPKIPSPTSKMTEQKRKTFISMLLGRRQDAR